MKSLNQFKNELAEGKHHVITFGRMNPITVGHEAVVEMVRRVATEFKADHTVIVSHSYDQKKNPLKVADKLKYAKHAFPGTNVAASSSSKPSILFLAADLYDKGVRHLHIVVGSDRLKEMETLLNRYNGKKMAAAGEYNFKSITVHSAGERDPDADGTTGISASKMREFAAVGDKKSFSLGCPSRMSQAHRDEMYHDVRQGMGFD